LGLHLPGEVVSWVGLAVGAVWAGPVWVEVEVGGVQVVGVWVVLDR